MQCALQSRVASHLSFFQRDAFRDVFGQLASWHCGDLQIQYVVNGLVVLSSKPVFQRSIVMLNTGRVTGACCAFLIGTFIYGSAYAVVDINLADSAMLAHIKGIGPAKARLIVEERNKHGRYKDAADLVSRVRGIGTKSVETLQKAGLTIEGGARPAARAPTASAPGPLPAAAMVKR